MNKIQFSRTLMIAAILLIVTFQGYWLNRLYKEEKEGLKKETNGIFRDVVYNLQLERFKSDTFFYNTKATTNNLFVYNAVNAIRKKVATIQADSGKILRSSPTFENKTFVTVRSGLGVIDSVHHLNTKDTFFIGTPRIIINRRIKPESNTGASTESLPLPDTAMMKQLAKNGAKVVVGYGNSNSSGRTQMMMPATPDQVKSISILRDSGIVKTHHAPVMSPEKSFIRMISNGKVFDDSLPVKKLDSAYQKELSKAALPVGFHLNIGKLDSAHQKDTAKGQVLATEIAKVGIMHPYWYQATFDNPAGFLLKKILPQLLFSFFLVAFTTLAFVFLYRTLAAQRKLTEIKNDFISNITHELKTPIATVNVAIEALRDFGGLKDPVRTKEYLDISGLELQRLALLVDKVLKFSLFENKEIELHKEPFDLKQLASEVADSMKLQFEKHNAVVSMETTGDNFMIDADRLHITSVIYNLLDNALKYSKEEPRIGIELIRQPDYFELRVSDNGVGISDEYKRKIFDQFFRVPNGDRHNIKGYGLGLSYVNHIVKQHNGFIEVESALGKGSTFIVRLAFADKNVIDFGNGRKMFRKGNYSSKQS